MKCHWSGQAVIGTGIVLLLAVAYLALPQRQIRLGLSLAMIPVGLLALVNMSLPSARQIDAQAVIAY